ncbi:hypothetical protein [Ekhidna sp.]|uniref:hypothetical protein n=1 Tax=Ekhidna sp. TaxID=2608089 RepID=UPI003CCBFF49
MNIEELLRNRKDQLDQDSPPPELWDNIKTDWKSEAKHPIHFWKIAAVIFITCTIGLLFHNITLQNRVDQLATLGDISEEYRIIENNYLAQINEIESQIPINEVKGKSDFEWIFQELHTLEEVNKLYRRDIGSIHEDQLVNILIDHYEKKIRLLKKLELEIERTNKIEHNEKNTTRSVNI